MQKFSDLKNRFQSNIIPTVAIAGANDESIVEMAKNILDQKIAQPILIGEYDEIKNKVDKMKIDKHIEIINESDLKKTALVASGLVREKKADILMKGKVSSPDFLKAVLDKEKGIRGKDILCHFTALEIKGYKKMLFMTDAGMVTFPNLDEKIQILDKAVNAIHNLGISDPNVAVLSITEDINPKIQSSVDAAELVKLNQKRKIDGCTIEGPIAFDVALFKEAAEHKGIKSNISGNVDLLLVPNIEVGNMTAKAMMYVAKAKMAGLILGATNPVILTSRSDTGEAKINALILARSILKNENIA